jgi:outer membrane protein assembly factor BamB
MITELRLAAPPPTDGVQALPSACLVEPFDEGEGKKLRLAHGSMLSDCGISLDTYALVPVQWAEGIGEAPRGGGEPRFTEYHYVLKSLASYMEGAKAAGSFLAAIDVMGLTAPSLSELVAEFGQPTSFVVDGDGRDFLIDSLRYGDLVLQMDDARAFLSSVTFHDRSYLYARKIGVGSASGEVYAELGKPLRTEVEAPAVSRTVPDRTLLIWPVPGETTSKIRYADKGIEVSLRDDKVESVTRVWQAPPPVLPAKAAATVPAFDWPSLLGPDGNGQSREVDWNPRSIATPKVAWTAGVGSGYSGVVVQGGRLYAAGLKAGEFTVSCLDAATGRKVWQRVVPSADKPYATPVVDGDSLFVLTTDGLLHRLDTRSGRLVWSRDLVREYGVLRPTFGFQGALMVEGGLILVTANTAGMAIRRDTGELAWTSDLPPKAFRSLDRQFSNGVSYATPTVYGDAGNRQALFVGWDGLSSVDVRTGKESWKFPWDVEPAYCCGNPLAFEGQVLVPSALDAAGNVAGALLNLGSTGPSVAWRTSDLFVAWYSITPLVIGGSIYTMYYGQGIGALVVNPTSIRCLDLETGRLLWQESFGPARTGKQFGLTAANGILVVLDDQGMLYTAEASPEGFRELARCDVLQGAQAERLFFAPPVLCGGRLYCRNLSEVICIDVRR